MHNAGTAAAESPMSAPSPRPPRSRFDLAAWRPSRRAWLWMLLAFAAGLGLFALVWNNGRKQHDFYRPGEAPPTAAETQYTPLPVPSGEASGETSGLDPASAADAQTSRPAEVEQPRLVETAPPPPVPSAGPDSTVAAGAFTQPVPLAGSTPSPRYPARALQRGESGTVLVQARIGPDGVPTSVTVARGSGSRVLDRAAVDAVRRWRFQPALQDGRPAVGTVNVPIEFTPQQ